MHLDKVERDCGTALAIPGDRAAVSYTHLDVYKRQVSYNGKVPNAISDLKNVKTLTENTRLLSIVYVEYLLLNDLTLKADIGLDLSNTRQSNYAPSYTSLGADKKGVASIGHKSVYTWPVSYTHLDVYKRQN